MTKPREKTREELQAEIEDGKKKIQQFENREKMLRQKLSKEERRTRSHRLIVRGAVFESIVPEAKNMTDEEATKFAIQELTRMQVINGPQDVLDSHRERVKKAYPAYFDTYDRMPELVDYLDSFGNLYCVGRNGQHRYNNMDHSMATSFEAVDNIISGKKDKKNIWSVNTEKEYHEEKKN